MFNQEIILTPSQCESIIDMNKGFTPSKVIKKHKDVGAHTHTNKRYKTLIIQLSENYKGGELVVWDGDDEIICDTTIGNMILFPSELYHQAKVLEEGVRYVMVFFLKRKHLGIRKSII